VAYRFAPNSVDAILALAGGDELERAVETPRPGGKLAYPIGVELDPKKRRGIKFIPLRRLAGIREFQRLNSPAPTAVRIFDISQ
jgi:NADPH2:quinone reductase